MKYIILTILGAVTILTVLGFMFPIAAIGILILNIAKVGVLFQSMYSIIVFSIFILVGYGLWCVMKENSEDHKEVISRLKTPLSIAISAIIFLEILYVVVPKDEKTLLAIVGAQVLYDSEFIRSSAKESGELIQNSIKALNHKVKEYSIDNNISL